MEPTIEFIRNIKETPVYVGFFHGEFDTCPTRTSLYGLTTPDPATQPTMKIPESVSLMQFTKPGEKLVVNSSILYYMFHKKQFYTSTLMPLFAVRSPADVLHHRDAEYLYWDMAERKGISMENVGKVEKRLLAAVNPEGNTQDAKEALKVMHTFTSRKPYEASDKTQFSEIYRFMGGDTVPNLLLSSMDETMQGLGLYRFSPSTGKVDKLLLETIQGIPRGGDLRLYHLTNYIARTGGGRMILFSCNSLADDKLKPNLAKKALAAREAIQALQERYITRNPVMSPEQNWNLFEEAFPKVFLPNLEFVNPYSLKALDNSWKHWLLYKMLMIAEGEPQTYTGSLRYSALQEATPYGRRSQNLGQTLGNTVPKSGEGAVSYFCRRGQKGCTIQGGTRKTSKRTRKTRRSKKSTPSKIYRF